MWMRMCTCSYMCLCVYVYVGTYSHLCLDVQVRGQHQLSFSVNPHVIFWEGVSHWTWSSPIPLDCLARGLPDFASPVLQTWRLCLALTAVVSLGARSPCSQGMDFKGWAIFSDPREILKPNQTWISIPEHIREKLSLSRSFNSTNIPFFFQRKGNKIN